MDKDKSGDISSSELKKFLRKLGMNPTQEQIDSIVMAIGGDDFRNLDFFDFCGILQSRLSTPNLNTSTKKSAFNCFDKFGIGFVSTSDIRNSLLVALHTLPKEEVDDVIKWSGLESSRKISEEEFERIVFPTTRKEMEEFLNNLRDN